MESFDFHLIFFFIILLLFTLKIRAVLKGGIRGGGNLSESTQAFLLIYTPFRTRYNH